MGSERVVVLQQQMNMPTNIHTSARAYYVDRIDILVFVLSLSHECHGTFPWTNIRCYMIIVPN